MIAGLLASASFGVHLLKWGELRGSYGRRSYQRSVNEAGGKKMEVSQHAAWDRSAYLRVTRAILDEASSESFQDGSTPGEGVS
jgi:hypothetical protein